MPTPTRQIATHEQRHPERKRNRARSGGGTNTISSTFA